MLAESTTPRPPAAMIPRRRVHIAEKCVPVGTFAGSTREPQVELVRDGDVVRSIRITCSCGETLVLDCDYNSAAA